MPNDKFVRETIEGGKGYALLHHWNRFFDECDPKHRNLHGQLTRYVDGALPTGDGGDRQMYACIPYKQNDVCVEGCIAGRAYAHKSISLQNMPKAVRHTLADGVLLDWDMVNAHPVFAHQYAIDHGLPCDMLSKLVLEREHNLGALACALGKSHSEAKRLVLAVLFGLDLSKVRWEQTPPQQ